MAEDRVHGWVLLPVSVDAGYGYEDDPTTYDFENEHAWFDSDTLGGGGAWGFISTEEAPTFDKALEKMQRVW